MTPEQRKRRRRGRWITVGITTLLVGVAAGAFWYDRFGPTPRIVVSPGTTRITSPLTGDGLPDYKAALLAGMRDGVAADENGAVLLWRVVWDEVLGGKAPGDARKVCAAIGMPSTPPVEDRVEDFYWPTEKSYPAALSVLRERWPSPKQPASTPASGSDDAGWGIPSTRRAPSDLSDSEALEEYDLEIDEVASVASWRPWTRADLPFMAEWVDAHQRGLDLIVRAAARNEWYAPTPEMFSGGRPSRFPDPTTAEGLQHADRWLAARAMLHLASRGDAAAWRDIHAGYGLARFAFKGSTLLDCLVGMSIASQAMDRTLLLCSSEPSKEVAQRMLADLRAVELQPDLARRLDQGERFAGLGAMIEIAVKTTSAQSILGEGDLTELIDGARIDWNVPMRDWNLLVDEQVAAAKLPRYPDRIAGLQAVASSLNQRQPADSLQALTMAGRSSAVSDGLCEVFFSSAVSTAHAIDCVRMKLRLVEYAAALAVHHADNGAYPASLDELTPELIPEPPVDLFLGKPLVYRRTMDGYLLYSLGPNGADDGGSMLQTAHYTLLSAERDKAPGVCAGMKLTEPYWRNSETGEWELSADSEEVAGLKDKVPDGADDIAIRLPIEPQPWPWEVAE